MRLIALFVRSLIMFVIGGVAFVFATAVVLVGAVVMLLFGRRVGNFRVYTQRPRDFVPPDFQDFGARPPMRDVTPKKLN
jgi:hypothetical protein